jgi:hypothetical protein
MLNELLEIIRHEMLVLVLIHNRTVGGRFFFGENFLDVIGFLVGRHDGSFCGKLPAYGHPA